MKTGLEVKYEMPLYAIIRLRGQPDVPYDVEYTLKLLRLHKKFHCTLTHTNQSNINSMLNKVKDWITWGEIDRETLTELLRKRGKIVGNKPLTDDFVKDKLKLSGGIEELADKLLKGELYLNKLSDIIKPVFRLHPPKGGFDGTIKKPFGTGGETGYRGEKINELLKKMI